MTNHIPDHTSYDTQNSAPSTGKIPVMGHLVLGYPSLAESIKTAEQYADAGIQILELQIPFSHPTADGPVITAACQKAVADGVSVSDCLDAIRTLRARYPAQEIAVMTYANRAYRFGATNFFRALSDLKVNYLIIPDWPVDTWPEVPGMPAPVPVIAANVEEKRLAKLLSRGYAFYYLMSDFKITGEAYGLHPKLRGLIARIRGESRPGTRVAVGFGISSPEEAVLAVQEADIAVIGSALIQAREQNRLEALLTGLGKKFLKTPDGRDDVRLPE